MTSNSRRARLEELLGIEATEGLSPDEATELDALLAAFPDEDPDALELAAAAVHLALCEPEEMPPRLTEKLHLAAIAFAPASAVPRTPRSQPAWLMWTGWTAAASLAIVLIWTQWPRAKEMQHEVTLTELRDTIKRSATAKAETFAGDRKGVAGSIVWSDKEQVGVLEVRGLPPIDAAAGTYQLWIVDGGRKDSEPIDGGVFTVNADGSTMVRIRAPIQVKNAVAFAITKEKEPGGVVVSKVKPENYELVLTKKG